jgi:hypothetical protein
VLVGDSFVAGDSNTQQCILAEQLLNTHQQDVYSLGHGGDGLADYTLHLKTFTADHPDARALLFFFEGNDFFKYTPFTFKTSLWQRYLRPFKQALVYKFTRLLYMRRYKPENLKQGIVGRANGEPIAFAGDNADYVLREAPLTETEMGWEKVIADMRGNIAHIFFIPDKFRIYGEYTDVGARRQPLPDRQWEYLSQIAKNQGIPVTNLTPALKAEAQKLLPEKKFVWWRDDTHWNCAGLAVAARETARVISAAPDKAP